MQVLVQVLLVLRRPRAGAAGAESTLAFSPPRRAAATRMFSRRSKTSMDGQR
jgi:hypothetical protein